MSLTALCLLAGGACKRKGRTIDAEPSSSPSEGMARPTPARAEQPVPDAADVVIHLAFAHAGDAFAVKNASLDYVHQDGTLDATYGRAQFEFGKRKHPPPPPPPDDPNRPIGAPVPAASPPQLPFDGATHACPRVIWVSGKLYDTADAESCAYVMTTALHHPHCTVREVWKRAIAKGAPPRALAQLRLEAIDILVEAPRQVWQFTIEDAPRNIHISEEIADDCEPIVEKPAR